MNMKLVPYVLAGSMIVLAAWLVHAPREAQADVPSKYHEMVRKGLEYLAKKQHADGHWEGDGGQHPVAMTGLVGLALLMERDRSQRAQTGRRKASSYAAPMRQAADWLLEKCQGHKRDGLLFSGHASETTRYMEGHGLATIFLAGTVMEETDDRRRSKLREVLGQAVKYIVKARSSRGGWHHTSKVEGHDFDDVLVTVIQMQALQAAEYAGAAFPDDCLVDAKEYLAAKVARQGKEKQDRRPILETAGALAVCCGGGEFEPCLTWFKDCQAALPSGSTPQFGRDELLHYYYAQALFQAGSEAWTKYRTALFDHLERTQNADGSWPAATGFGVGPVYATALWCTLLQLDRNNHPSRRREVRITMTLPRLELRSIA
jgi:hypothetical protein